MEQTKNKESIKKVCIGYDSFFLEESLTNMSLDQVTSMFEIGGYYQLKTDTLSVTGKITKISNHVSRESKIVTLSFDDNGNDFNYSLNQDVDQTGWWYFNDVNGYNFNWGGEYEVVNSVNKLDHQVSFVLEYD